MGFHQVSLEVEGKDLNGLGNEAGGHRVQRIPPTERKGRVHTSTVTVAVLDGPAKIEVSIAENDLKVEWFSGSGAGGQHRNKHQNSCRLTHLPSGLVRTAQTRSRDNSYKLALEELTKEINNIRGNQIAGNHNDNRNNQIGSGMRGDKRRTYRFRDDQVVDDVTGKSALCSKVMRGNFDLLWK